MCVCMCVYGVYEVGTGQRLFIYVRVWCIYVCMYIRMHVCMYFKYVCMYTHTRTHTRGHCHSFVLPLIRAHTYICIHTYIYTHTWAGCNRETSRLRTIQAKMMPCVHDIKDDALCTWHQLRAKAHTTTAKKCRQKALIHGWRVQRWLQRWSRSVTASSKCRTRGHTYVYQSAGHAIQVVLVFKTLLFNTLCYVHFLQYFALMCTFFNTLC